ncbi:MAG: TonB-dependent receptor [Acidobacteriota bacterium]
MPVLLLMLMIPAATSAQTAATITITIEDSSGEALAGATVTDSGGKLLGRTDASGHLDVSCAAPCRIRVAAQGFATQSLQLAAATTVRLRPAAHPEQVTVTAYRTPLGELESPASTRILTQRALRSTAAITLDDQVRQLPGVELFRRTSSLVANPTTQGISLRGLGSTSASRTLVTEDDVPLNDPIGGWIHWEEPPELSIQSIEVVRGGASDLYGSAAIGGVVSVIPIQPTATQGELYSSYGGEGTYDDNLLGQTKHGPWGLLGSGGLLGTDGYIQEAPYQRGPVDQPSNVHSQNALALVEHDRGPLRLFARGTGFNESRHNGTLYQMNATRLIRYATGGDWQGPRSSALAVRLYGSREGFRQTFSSISNLPTVAYPTCSYRCGEIPVKRLNTADNELGAAAHWSQPLGAGLLLLGGADVHDVRVWDRQQLLTGSDLLTNLHDHQRDSGVYVEMMWVRNAWTVTASARMDFFQNYDGQELQWNGSSWIPAPAQPSQRDERPFDPRVGVSRKLTPHWALSASGFRAFRTPTPDELYNSFQVGNVFTAANSNLLSERATGWETGVVTQQPWGSVRASYFLTQVNRPITSFTINGSSSPILRKRENLGQIESRGVSLDFELMPLRWMAVDGGYQYAHATVTGGTQDYGKWIPEVARNMATLNLRAFKPAWGTLSLQSRLSGRQYDDDANVYLLHGFFRLDAYASHNFGSRLEVFAAGENLLNRAIEDSKTPTTTLGMPRVARAGFLVRFGGAGGTGNPR